MEATGEGGARQPERKVLALPVRFGIGRASETAVTGNVSECGLFVVTSCPLEPGTAIVLLVEFPSSSIPLHGIVAWKRDNVQEPGVGMGVILVHPPAWYVHLVRKLSATGERGGIGTRR